MNDCCVVVADAARARLYLLGKAEDLNTGSRLIERADLVDTKYLARGAEAPGVTSERNTNRRAGPLHPYGEKRKVHRLVVEERFAHAVAREAQKLTRCWLTGVVMLVAEPRMLGLLREPLRSALNENIELKELAKDYMHLAPAELQRRLNLSGPQPSR
jgi:protein required for attachment to host cells